MTPERTFFGLLDEQERNELLALGVRRRYPVGRDTDGPGRPRWAKEASFPCPALTAVAIAVNENAQSIVPYRSGFALACTTMVLARFGVADPPDEELLRCLDTSQLQAQEVQRVGESPELQARILNAFGLSARVRTDGRAARLGESLSHGHAVIAFLGKKAFRHRWLSGMPWFPFGVAKAGYHPVVVTRVQSSWMPFRSRVTFHDPDPTRGGEGRSLRRGRHSIWRAGPSFEQVWGVWQGWMPIAGYFTLKMPDLQPMRRLRPWVFVEAWRDESEAPNLT